MNAKPKTVLRRLFIVVAVLIGWVGIALLLTFGSRPSRTQSVASSTSVAPTAAPPPFIFTQFVAGGPLTLATQAPDGSLVVITQYPVQPLTFYGPDRYVVVDPAGTQREVSEFHSVQLDVRSLGLFDFRHQPDIKLDDLK
jgi:hypothetical protein